MVFCETELMKQLGALSYLFGKPLRPQTQVSLASTQSWWDDYYTVATVKHAGQTRRQQCTYAIGEPRYHQQNVSYLLVGDDRSLLFDTGPGVRNPRPVAEHLTDKPLSATCSHLHYDHSGGLHHFEEVQLAECAAVQRRATTAAPVLAPLHLHLGLLEGVRRQPLTVAKWWADGAVIDLGERQLQVLHLPGHTTDSMALFDQDADLVLVGDLIYPGGAYAYVPSSDLADYEHSLDRLATTITATTQVLSAHTGRPPVFDVPVMNRADVVALRDAVAAVRAGKVSGRGWLPRRYPAGRGMEVLAGWPGR